MLGKCRECGKEISINATSCPRCGEPDPFFAQGIRGKLLESYGQQEIECPTCRGGGLLYRYVEKRYHEADAANSVPKVHSNYWSSRPGEDSQRFGRYRNTVKCGTCNGRGQTTRESLKRFRPLPVVWLG